MISLFDFFTDPILRPSSLGCMLMSFSSALVGVIVFLRKRSLIGETLSHATFPGIVLGGLLAASFSSIFEGITALAVLTGAFLSALLGLKALIFLEERLKVKSDTALCFVLASFFGVGILLASYVQQIQPLWYKQALGFLYGQPATMTNLHITIYATFSLVILGFILIFFRYLETVNFDTTFAQTLGIGSKQIDQFTFLLIVLAIVVGIRSVGVILMAGMLICPAIAARPLSRNLSQNFLFAGSFGLVSGFLGNYFSVAIPSATSQNSYSLPTGPMILISSTLLCLFSLLLAPHYGLIPRYLRMRRFQFQCSVENALKSLWKQKGHRNYFPKTIFSQLKKNGWIDPEGHLTSQGLAMAEKIVRLHRLWEVYLVDYLGQKAEKVHKTAEELEHLLSPDLERELTLLLQNPQHDPHHQPIPPTRDETP